MTNDEKTVAMLSHLLGAFFGFIPALIIWLLKKDESEFIAESAKEALNFQISFLIYSVGFTIVSSIISAITFGFGAIITIPLSFALAILFWVFIIKATIEVNKGNQYTYPFTIRLI